MEISPSLFHFLLVLLKPLHGYQIMQEVEKASGGELTMGAGTCYGLIARCLQEKLIELGIFPKVINYDKYVYLLIDKILDSRIVLKDLNSFCNHPVIVDKQFNFIIDTSLKVDSDYISALCHQ